MQTPFSREERQGILDRYFPAHQQWLDLDFQSVTASGAGAAVSAEKDQLASIIAELLDQYRRNLPVPAISRCPYTSQVLYHSLDPYGIDGLWWNYQAPVRPIDFLMPGFLSLTGALLLQESPENVPFLCVPGPGAPYVVPEILSDDQVKAVLSSTNIGKHTGYIMAYFTDDPSAVIPRMNCWGANRWELLNRRGTFMWGEFSPPESRFDFDLRPWIERGKMLWIQPGDRTLSLHQGVADCPFLACTGTKKIQRIQNGIVHETGGKGKEGIQDGNQG
jgi:hypothetical protein